MLFQPMDETNCQLLNTDSDPRYFYSQTRRGYFFFESTLHKGHYLAVDENKLVLKKTDQPDIDDAVRFTLLPTDCCH